MAELDFSGVLLQMPIVAMFAIAFRVLWAELRKAEIEREATLIDIYEKQVAYQNGTTTKIVAELKTLSLLVLEFQKHLAIHDMTVTGINPSAGKNIDERAEKAVHKFTEFTNTIMRIEQLIQNNGK